MVSQTDIVLQLDFEEAIQDTIAEIITWTPRIVGALLILIVGWIIGRIVAGLVARIADSVELDRMVLRTPLGRMLGGTEDAVSHAFGRLAAWFIYALAILAAADVLAVELLSEWVGTAVTYLPAFIAGLLIIVIGFVVADFIADVITRTESVTNTRYTNIFADGARILLYFIVITMGLDTMGVDVGILYTFAQAAAWGVAAGIALAIGIAFGWGGKDYVSKHIDEWVGRSPAPMSSGGSRGGSSGGAGNRTGDRPTDGGLDDSGRDETRSPDRSEDRDVTDRTSDDDRSRR